MPEPLPFGGIVPMMASPSQQVPAGAGWAFELKWDGVRALAYVDGPAGAVRLESRNLNDITPRYPEIHPLAGACGGRRVVLDGEIVAFDEAGRPSFGHLQPRMHLTNPRQIAQRMSDTPVVFLLFDILHLDGESTRSLTWPDRRRVLESLELAGPAWQTPSVHTGDGEGVLAASKQGGLEGIVAKRLTSCYEPGRRSRDWLKIKNICRQELVVGGWLPGAGSRSGRIGALLVGYHDGGALHFAGKVGTGFTDKELASLAAAFEPLARATSPFAEKVPYREARFLDPVLVAEIEFTEWTRSGTLRHPSYKGLRSDKAAEDVVRET